MTRASEDPAPGIGVEGVACPTCKGPFDTWYCSDAFHLAAPSTIQTGAGDREAIAKIIDPLSFGHPTVHTQHMTKRRAAAFSKADDILAALPSVPAASETEAG